MLRTVVYERKIVGAFSRPSKEFQDIFHDNIDHVGFSTFQLKTMPYRSSDLGSMLSMFNPVVSTNLAKNSKKKQDNASV